MSRNKSQESIKLSPKYGVNPTIPVCFFCGEPKNEIALLGKIGDGRKGEDIEAPMHMILDYEPCDSCKEKMDMGITLIGVVKEPIDNRPPILTESDVALYPTGSWVVISEEFVKRGFSEEVSDTLLKERKILVDQSVVEEIRASSEV